MLANTRRWNGLHINCMSSTCSNYLLQNELKIWWMSWKCIWKFVEFAIAVRCVTVTSTWNVKNSFPGFSWQKWVCPPDWPPEPMPPPLLRRLAFIGCPPGPSPIPIPPNPPAYITQQRTWMQMRTLKTQINIFLQDFRQVRWFSRPCGGNEGKELKVPAWRQAIRSQNQRVCAVENIIKKHNNDLWLCALQFHRFSSFITTSLLHSILIHYFLFKSRVRKGWERVHQHRTQSRLFIHTCSFCSNFTE